MDEDERGFGPTAAFDDAFHRDIVDNLADGVYYVDRERRIRYWNHGAESLTGYRAEAVVGQHCFDDLLKHVDAEGYGLCAGGCPLQATMEDGERREMEVWLRHRDGSRRPVRVRTAPIRRAGAIVGAVEVFDDATSLLAARGSPPDALTDELTGLANRRLFDLILPARLADLERHAIPVGLLLGDLDHFKAVNDEHGHLAGDRVLRAVAETLRQAVRAGDLVVRWGGEEFAVIATHATRTDLARLAERLRALVAAADAALYAAKAAGRDQVRLAE
jgi:PAS domain S-box-containing protein